MASLEIFSEATVSALRKKSIQLTGYLEHLLLADFLDTAPEEKPFVIITPSDPAERGAQLSLRLQSGLMDDVLSALQANGIIVDERKPDVIRVAPAPLYNTFADVWEFVQIFLAACRKAMQENSTKL